MSPVLVITSRVLSVSSSSQRLPGGENRSGRENTAAVLSSVSTAGGQNDAKDVETEPTG